MTTRNHATVYVDATSVVGDEHATMVGDVLYLHVTDGRDIDLCLAGTPDQIIRACKRIIARVHDEDVESAYAAERRAEGE